MKRKKPVVRNMAKVKNHSKKDPGGWIVECEECGQTGLVDEKDKDKNIKCEVCDVKTVKLDRQKTARR